MADLSDVENAIVAVIGVSLYPSGGSGPNPITSDTVNIAAGWPLAAQLETDVGNNVVNISVFPLPGSGRNTTRYPRGDEIVTPPAHTLTATVAGNQITIGGTVSTPQNVIVLCGTRYVFPYSVPSAAPLNSIAAAVAALIAAAFPGTSASGAVITIAGNPGIVRARIAGAAATWIEQRRQQLTFDVSIWAATPTQRANLAKVVDVALAQLDWLTLADQSAARIRCEMQTDIDDAQKVTIYRRCFRFTVEYPTVLTGTAYETGAIGVTPTIDDGPSAPSYT